MYTTANVINLIVILFLFLSGKTNILLDTFDSIISK